MDFPHEEAGFREDSLRAAQWRQAGRKQPLGAVMVRIIFRQQSYQWSRVEKYARAVQRPNSARCSLFVERSFGPPANFPELLPASSNALR